MHNLLLFQCDVTRLLTRYEARFVPYNILAWTARSVNCHIALKTMFYLLNRPSVGLFYCIAYSSGVCKRYSIYRTLKMPCFLREFLKVLLVLERHMNCMKMNIDFHVILILLILMHMDVESTPCPLFRCCIGMP